MMQKLEQGIYTRQQVIDVLHAKYAARQVKFRYDLLDKNDIKKVTLQTVESGEIQMSSLSEIKRTARFRLRDDGTINWLSDRIQPFFMLKMPDVSWAEWSLGIFLLCSPKRRDQNRLIYRDVEAYDGLQVLVDDKFDYRLTLAAGSNYITNIKNILSGAGITKTNLESTTETLTVAREWEPGTAKLKVINELLKDINYTQLWVDEWGFYTASKYRTPAERAVEYAYKNDELSILAAGIEEELDLFNVPNKWTVTVSNAETAPLSSTYINSNAASPTSTVSRGRTIVDYRTIDYVSSQAVLDDYVKKIAFQASQIYGTVTFETALMPMHSYNDVLKLEYSPLNINDKYEEIGWTLPLHAGEYMRHEVRKVVPV
jgi:hypothetical protein